MEHELEAISVRPVKVKEVRENGEIILRGQPPEEMVGCRVCGMVLEETLEIPCPGRKIKDIVAELTEGLSFPDDEKK